MEKAKRLNEVIQAGPLKALEIVQNNDRTADIVELAEIYYNYMWMINFRDLNSLVIIPW